MSGTQARLSTEVPRLMRTLERDARGYPVPFIVLRDKAGKPHFTINSSVLVADCVRKRLCSICGKRMGPLVWFVGGSRCFLHRMGAFLDPPLHLECAEYALRVCPFLAASSYGKRIDDRTLDPGALPDDVALVRHNGALPQLPERFGLGAAKDYRISNRTLFVVDHWEYVEFWRNGTPCNAPDSGQPAPDHPTVA